MTRRFPCSTPVGSDQGLPPSLALRNVKLRRIRRATRASCCEAQPRPSEPGPVFLESQRLSCAAVQHEISSCGSCEEGRASVAVACPLQECTRAVCETRRVAVLLDLFILIVHVMLLVALLDLFILTVHIVLLAQHSHKLVLPGACTRVQALPRMTSFAC